MTLCLDCDNEFRNSAHQFRGSAKKTAISLGQLVGKYSQEVGARDLLYKSALFLW